MSVEIPQPEAPDTAEFDAATFEDSPEPQARQTFVRERREDGSLKTREIWVPNKAMSAVHQRLLRDVYADHPEQRIPSAKGGMRGVQLVDNIAPHAGSWDFYMLDLHDAFPSVDGEKLAREIWLLNPTKRDPDQILDFLKRYCLRPDGQGLMQGMPSSPLLFNLACRRMDFRLREVASRHFLEYTRWLDDLTFSAPKTEGPIGKAKRTQIREAVENAGWTINHRKSRHHSLANGPVTITGISLYPSGHWRLSPKLVGRVKAGFDAFEEAIDNGEPTDTQIGSLHGHKGIVDMAADPRRSSPTRIERQLRDQYEGLRRRAFIAPDQLALEAAFRYWEFVMPPQRKIADPEEALSDDFWWEEDSGS